MSFSVHCDTNLRILHSEAQGLLSCLLCGHADVYTSDNYGQFIPARRTICAKPAPGCAGRALSSSFSTAYPQTKQQIWPCWEKDENYTVKAIYFLAQARL